MGLRWLSLRLRVAFAWGLSTTLQSEPYVFYFVIEFCWGVNFA